MNIDEIVNRIDIEISRLQQARNLIASVPSTAPARRGPKPGGIRKPMSAEARGRIAAAQKARWAAARKTSKKKTA